MLETKNVIFVFPTLEDIQHLHATCDKFMAGFNGIDLERRWNNNHNSRVGNDVGILCARFQSDGVFTSFGDLSCYTSATSIEEIEAGKAKLTEEYSLYKLIIYRRPRCPSPGTIEETLIF